MRIGPHDARYRAVVEKRFNKRFIANPAYVQLVSTAEQAVSALAEAVSEGSRVVATAGGHCLEGFVSASDVRAIIDVSPMKRVYYDAEMNAVAVEPGATVGETFKALFEQWGVVVPLGEYPGIGMGGHVVGGAFGFLCRQLGLASDYLYAVEVITVDRGGRVVRVVATSEPADPCRDLWWAHTGGGGGNFGIVTRYWFRSPGASSRDPRGFLPRAPASIATFHAEWDWNEVDESAFVRLLANHGAWGEANSGVTSPSISLWTLLAVHRKELGKIVVRGVTTADAVAERQVSEYLAAISDGLIAPRARELARMSWLEFALNPFPDLFGMPPGGVSVKVKDALLRQRLTERQIAVANRYLTDVDHGIMGGMLGLASYGGRVNAVAPDATAAVGRNAIFDMSCNTGWVDPLDEEKNVAWVRAFYREMFAEAGGVPVPGKAYDGALINHPDVDLADPTWNTSGVAWHTLYYQSNYARLQQVKARWDPGNVFRHALSIEGL